MNTDIFIDNEIPRHRRKKGKKTYALQVKLKEGERPILNGFSFWKDRYKDWANFGKYEKYRDALTAKESYERKAKGEYYWNYLSKFDFKIVKI